MKLEQTPRSQVPLLARAVLLTAVLAVLPTSATDSISADEWQLCAFKIADVQDAALHSKAVASQLGVLADELQSLKDDYDECVRWPEMYDYANDGCAGPRADYDDQVDEYDSKLSEWSRRFEALLNHVETATGYCL